VRCSVTIVVTVTEASWREVAQPPGETRGLGVHDGALAAFTSDGLFVLEGGAWRPLDAGDRGASVLPSGRLVMRSVSGSELTAYAIGPDGAVWRGVRTSELRFYATPGPGGMNMMQPAYPVTERLERDGVVVRDGLAARDIAFDAEGRVWVAATSCLEVLDGGAWRTALPRATSQIAIAADDTIVVGTPTTGFRSSDGRTFKNLPGRATEKGTWGSLDLDAENVQQIVRAPDGTPWARIADGVLAWTGDRWASRNLGLTVIPRKGSRHLRTISLAIVGDVLHVATSAGVFTRRADRSDPRRSPDPRA
jgi:hypothetical protein